jgi:SAM-dependent methyltransferase
MERLKKVAEKELPNVTAVRADFMKPLFQDWSVDTIILAARLHEVFSDAGDAGVLDTLKAAGDALTQEGVLIIQDYLKPNPRLVELRLSSDRLRERFARFVREFRPRTVLFQESERGVQIDIANALDFLDRQCASTEKKWQEEMRETHRFFSEDDYRESAEREGLAIEEVQILPRDNPAGTAESDEVSFDFEYEQDWVQVVMVKQR